MTSRPMARYGSTEARKLQRTAEVAVENEHGRSKYKWEMSWVEVPLMGLASLLQKINKPLPQVAMA